MLNLNPAAAALDDPSISTKALTIGAEVVDTVTLIASALTGGEGVRATDILGVFRALAGHIATHTLDLIDLTDTSLVNQIISNSAVALGASVTPELASTIVNLITASNSALEQASSQLTSQQLLSAVSGVERLAQGAESDALANANTDSGILDAIVNAFTAPT